MSISPTLTAAIAAMDDVRANLISDVKARLTAREGKFTAWSPFLVVKADMEGTGHCTEMFLHSDSVQVRILPDDADGYVEIDIHLLSTDSLLAIELAMNRADAIIENIRTGQNTFTAQQEQEMLAAHSMQQIDRDVYSHGDSADPTSKFD